MATCGQAASISKAGLTLINVPIVHSCRQVRKFYAGEGMNEGIEEITTGTYEGFPVELLPEAATAAALALPFSGDTAGAAGTAGTLALASTTRWLRQ